MSFVNNAAWGPLPARRPDRASKLKPADRDRIRERRNDGESARALAAEYGVSVSTIYQNGR